jgi:hypothetical protein
MTPRQLVVRARHVPRRYFPGIGFYPCCPTGTPPAPRPPLCFEATTSRTSCQLAYLRPLSRLARAHAPWRPPGRALVLAHSPVARPSNALPRSLRSSETRVLPRRPPSLAGHQEAAAGATGYRRTPSPRQPRPQLR